MVVLGLIVSEVEIVSIQKASNIYTETHIWPHKLNKELNTIEEKLSTT